MHRESLCSEVNSATEPRRFSGIPRSASQLGRQLLCTALHRAQAIARHPYPDVDD
jgi:hypothetical protein